MQEAEASFPSRPRTKNTRSLTSRGQLEGRSSLQSHICWLAERSGTSESDLGKGEEEILPEEMEGREVKTAASESPSSSA